MTPGILYKYLPSKYVKNVLERGELLFRNLTCFRKCEEEQRADPWEAHHRDSPDNKVTITSLAAGRMKIMRGRFSFLNTTDSDLIYVFCLSKTFGIDLYEEFTSDACIEITHFEEFLDRVRRAVVHLPSTHALGLLHKDVWYYAPNERAAFDIKDAKEIVFAKDETFRHQDEYRLVFGARRAFRLTQAIVDDHTYDAMGDARKGVVKEKRITIGDISDIARVRYITELR